MEMYITKLIFTAVMFISVLGVAYYTATSNYESPEQRLKGVIFNAFLIMILLLGSNAMSYKEGKMEYNEMNEQWASEQYMNGYYDCLKEIFTDADTINYYGNKKETQNN